MYGSTMGEGIGQCILNKEHHRYLRVRGQFVADICFAGETGAIAERQSPRTRPQPVAPIKGSGLAARHG